MAKTSDAKTDVKTGTIITKALPPLWRRWAVQWDFFTPLYASTPADPEVIRAWLESRTPTARPPGGRSIDEIQEEVVASLATESSKEDEIVERTLLVFQYAPCEGERVISLRADTIRAHLKDCARVISAQYIGPLKGERQFSTKVINGAYPDPARPWIDVSRPDGPRCTKPDREEDRFVHTFRGNALKRLQILDPPTVITFTLKTLGDSLKRRDLEYLFQYGGVHGYGGERSRDGGKYVATFHEITGQEG